MKNKFIIKSTILLISLTVNALVIILAGNSVYNGPRFASVIKEDVNQTSYGSLDEKKEVKDTETPSIINNDPAAPVKANTPSPVNNTHKKVVLSENAVYNSDAKTQAVASVIKNPEDSKPIVIDNPVKEQPQAVANQDLVNNETQSLQQDQDTKLVLNSYEETIDAEKEDSLKEKEHKEYIKVEKESSFEDHGENEDEHDD